jgi:RNA polymerase sigma factor (TIGR02999 family)
MLRRVGSRPDITELLNAASAGDRAAQETAYGLVYSELKKCAQRQRGKMPGISLSATALVHELFLRFQAQKEHLSVQSRAHFYSIASRAMRQIVIDHARRRGSVKRGGEMEKADSSAVLTVGQDLAENALDLDAALVRLEARDPDLARIVEWHFFGGLTFKEIGEELGRNPRTVFDDWELARSLLQKFMHYSPSAEG